jgi:glycosyltransferase involved in cell wall biosynthesis
MMSLRQDKLSGSMEVGRFIERALMRLAPRRSVLVRGGAGIAWTDRLFRKAGSCVKVDTQPGYDVDVVADPIDFQPANLRDTVVCFAPLNRVDIAERLCRTSYDALGPDGLMFLVAMVGGNGLTSAPPHVENQTANHDVYALGHSDIERMLRRARFAQWTVETFRDGALVVIAHMRRSAEVSTTKLSPYAVVPLLNGLAHTKALERALSRSGLRLRSIYIDNGSTDGTREWLNYMHGLDQVCIVNERNLGVAASWNIGIRIAIMNGADTVILCNNDTEPLPGTLERLASHVARGCAFVTGTGIPYCAPLEPVTTAECEVQLMSSLDFAVCMLSIRAVEALADFERWHGLRTLPDDAGLFDTRFYPGYFEDSDYSVRLALAGIPAVRDPGALFRHDAALTTRANPEVRLDLRYAFRRNEDLFRSKWGFSPLDDGNALRPPPDALRSVWGRIIGDIAFNSDEVVRHSVKAIGGPACMSIEPHTPKEPVS